MLKSIIAVLVLSFVHSECALPHCKTTELPKRLIRANVVNVVYTMESNCKMCVQQASRLPHLKRYLEKKGIKTHFIVGVSHTSDRLSGLVPHVQVNNRRVWRALGEQNDHFYVIDRCGRMVFEIINPWSNLNLPFVRSAVVTTQYSHRCGLCPIDYSHIPKEELEEYPALDKNSKTIPADATPLKMVFKIRHKHKGDRNIYNHFVKVAGVPEYHGHLPNDELAVEHSTLENPLRTHEGVELNGDTDNSRSYTKNITESIDMTTISIKNNEEERTQDSKEGYEHIHIDDNLLNKKEIHNNEDEKLGNSRQRTINDDYEDEEPPDIDAKDSHLTENQIVEKKVLFEHYKHILDWISHSEDYES